MSDRSCPDLTCLMRPGQWCKPLTGSNLTQKCFMLFKDSAVTNAVQGYCSDPKVLHAAGDSGAPMSTTPMASQEGSPQGPFAGSGSGEGTWEGAKGRQGPSAPEGSLTAKVRFTAFLIPNKPGQCSLHTHVSAGPVSLQ